MNEQIYCKQVKRTSLIVEQIRNDIEELKLNEDFDNDFFDEDYIESYLQFLVGYVHENDWLVIEDRPEKLGGKNDEGVV